MANPTTNYGFVLPSPSDLVTDLPADFDVALQGVDTRLKALQPGTTLGDLAYSSATADTNTRLAIGTTGQVLTVSGGVPAWSAAAAGAGAYGKTRTSGSNPSTTSTSYVAIDTTNLRITATPSGTTAVCVLTGFITNSGVTISDWRVNCGSGTTHGFQAYNGTYEGTTILKTLSTVITGLTAGTSYNFDWEWKVNAGTTTMIGDTATAYPRMQVIC